MAVLITGGHGFVGAWVARQVAERGEDVVIYDAAGPPDRILDAVQDRVRFVRGDILDYPLLEATIRESGARGIVHAAALVGAPVDANPHGAIRINVVGTLNVLEIVRQIGGVRLVYVSSGAVYGSAPGPLCETDPLTPSDPYGATKAASELLCDQYAAKFGVDVSSARIFFVYGPGRMPSPDSGFNTLIFGPLAGIETISYPRGRDQKADWTYVADAARGIGMMLDAQTVPHRAYNIATGMAHTVDDILAAVGRHATVNARVDIGPGVNLERGAPLDIARARSALGYSPEYDLDRGVRAYAEWLADGRN